MPIEWVFLAVSKMLFTIMGLAIVVWGALAYARMRRSPPVSGVPDASALAPIQERLTQLEQSTESIALQVERIAEGQRFVTKLLGDSSLAKAQTEQRQVEQHHL